MMCDTARIHNTWFQQINVLNHSTIKHPKSHRNHEHQWFWKWTTTCLETCRVIRDQQGWYLTPRDSIKLDFKKSMFWRFPRSIKLVADVLHLRSDSEPEQDTIGICVENDYNRCRECLIRKRFDHRKLGEKGSRAYLPEDLLISATCPLEESASHHYGFATNRALHSRCRHS